VIKINLLTGERQVVRASRSVDITSGQKMTVACSLMLLAAALLIGWRYWTLAQASSKLDADISAAQRETAQLHSIIEQVQQFEQRRTQLQQRVALIEQLRRDQTGPVHILDQISRALPPMLWLTSLKESPEGQEVLIEGRSTTLTGITDFVVNLEASGYFRRSVEIVSTLTETVANAGEVTRFSLRAVFQQPGSGASVAPVMPVLAVTPPPLSE
jgi:type IV pilus assembly protein PilN